MILIIPIIAYFIITVGLIFLSNKVLKNKAVEKRKRNRRWIIYSSLILSPVIGFLYFLFLFVIALDDHYDVKRGTFLWYTKIDNKTITEFPLIKPLGKVAYNSIGGDSPSIETGWGIDFTSKQDNKTLTDTIIFYLKKEGFKISEVDETQYYWIGKHKRNANNNLFSGYNKKGESLDLLLQRLDNGITRIECTIVY